MPEAFNRCVAGGGKVRTVKPNADTYIHVCVPKDGGPSVRGEVHHVKDKGKVRKAAAAKAAGKKHRG